MVFLTILVGAGGYVAYAYYSKMRIKPSGRMPPTRPMVPPRRPGAMPQRAPVQMPRDMFKRREEEKQAERKRLFERFGGRAEERPKTFSQIKAVLPQKAPHIKEISRIQKQVRELPSEKKEDVMEKLRGITQKHEQGRLSEEDVFKRLKGVGRKK